MPHVDDRSEPEAGTLSHAEEVLGFHDLLQIIAARCVNAGARTAILGLHSSLDRSVIERRLREIEDVRRCQVAKGQLPIAHTDVRKAVQLAAEKNELIDAKDLLAIAEVDRRIADICAVVSDDTDYPALHNIVSRLVRHDDLVAAVDRSIAPDGSIKDDASPALRSVRKNIRRSREDIRGYSEKLAREYGSGDYATFDGHRHMLLVPREKARGSDGIVHMASQSGESLYFEPLKLVEKNNGLETLLHEEHTEEIRVLTELTQLVSAVAAELAQNLDTWERLDAIRAKASFSDTFNCVSPTMSSDGSLALKQARHPLLEISLQETGKEVVPLDLLLEGDERVLVITGPNAGGKTVSLKTVGLLALMAQCGLQIPSAEGSRLPIFEHIFADIGDEQSIAASLSTFTSHLRHLDIMCRRSSTNTLCLVDEIGDGTDPDEGAALAISTLERLLENQSMVIATTHYGKVKTFTLKAPGISNGSMAFDDENGRPFYRLIQGMAGRSRGLETARRVGFYAPVVERAEAMVGKEAFRLETILSELQSQLLALEEERKLVLERTAELEEMLQSNAERRRDLDEFKEQHREQARRDAEEVLVRSRKEIEEIVRKIRETGADKAVVKDAHRRVKNLLGEVKKPEPLVPAANIRVGDLVAMSTSGYPRGRVMEVKGDEANLDIEGKRVRAKRAGLYKIDDHGAAPEKKRPVHIDSEVMETTSMDVRGLDREEALDAVDQFLDRAVLNNMKEIKIIHGVGGGILQRAIRAQLDRDSRVASKRAGGMGEGGDGVSFVRLR